MKHNNFNKIDFRKEFLPKTRKEQIGDIYRTDFMTILKIGFIILLSASPYLVLFMYKNTIFSNMILTKISEGEENIPQALMSILTFGGIQALTILLIFLVLSGVARVLRVETFGEGLFFKEDFIKGIKTNALRYTLYGLFLGLVKIGIDLSPYAFLSLDNPQIISGIFTGIYYLVLLPSVVCSCFLENLFNYRIINIIKDSFKLYIKCILFSLGIGLSFLLLSNILIINSLIIVILLLALACIFGFPALLLSFYEYLLYKIEKMNIEGFSEYKYKGLYIEDSDKD